MSRRKSIACALPLAILLGAFSTFQPATVGASSGRSGHAPAAMPVHVYAVTVLDARGRAAARFHRGDLLSLRIRWQVMTARKGDKAVVIWAVHYGRKVIYRHYFAGPARVGRWRMATTVRISRTAHLGTYTFEGKVVIGHNASWRVYTLRVVR